MFCVRVAIPMPLFLCLFHDACFNAYSKNFNAHTHYQFLIAISVSSVFFFFFSFLAVFQYIVQTCW